jgi:hypothetical protein
MQRMRAICVVILAACGGNSDTRDSPEPDAPPETEPPKLMFAIDTAPAPGETYEQALTTAREAGGNFLPQAIDWSLIEAGPDDTFGSAVIDHKKWDQSGPFAADATARVVRYTAAAATSSDNLRARYTLASGAISASVDATLVTATGGAQATMLLRFGSAPLAGNRCTDAVDDYAAIVLVPSGVAAATCQAGVFANHGLVAATASATIRIRRTATQLIFETGTTQVTALALTALPASFAGAARPNVFAGNDVGAATVELASLRVTGKVTWDNPSDRFVGIDAAFDVPGVLDGLHGPLGTPLVLNLRTINTVTTELPSDLEEIDPATGKVDMSRAEIRQRYREAIDYFLATAPNLTIAGFAVGNEIDAYYGGSAAGWAQFAVFTNDAIPYVRSKLPAGTPVSATITAAALLDYPTEVAAIEEAADTIFVTYYPLAPDFTAKDPGVVAGDVTSFLAATSKPLLFVESGFPSAAPSAECPTCSGSEAKQADFFHAMFAATDAHPTTQLRGFSVTWMTDLSDAAVDGFKIYYGVSAPTFVAYLATLGVRTQTGTPKQAWQQILDDAQARGLR